MAEMKESEVSWSEVISPQSKMFEVNVSELWKYRDLLVLLVKRDFVASYKQTILGPLWFFIQPILTTITFIIIFGKIAGISTGSTPPILFYLSGIILWNYFSECLNKTATVFRDNASIFGKVYFPRLIMPLSIIVSNFTKFLIQFFLFIIIWVFYIFFSPSSHITPNILLFLVPCFLLLLALFGLGTGILISALTTKYRDLVYLLAFGVQLFMYATPIIYSLQTVPPKYKTFILLNPLSSIIEGFRVAFTGVGDFSFQHFLYSTLAIIVVLICGVLVFNKVEKSFMDTV